MVTDTFGDVDSLGEQEFRLIFAGGHRFEIGGFPFVVEHRCEERRNSGQHLFGNGPIIGPEQRIEKPFEFFLVQRLESIHLVRAEVTVHRAGKENREFSEQFGVVGKPRGGKAIQIVEVTRMVTVDHGLRLSAKQFFERELDTDMVRHPRWPQHSVPAAEERKCASES
jgi:hypothetical protein